MHLDPLIEREAEAAALKAAVKPVSSGGRWVGFDPEFDDDDDAFESEE